MFYSFTARDHLKTTWTKNILIWRGGGRSKKSNILFVWYFNVSYLESCLTETYIIIFLIYLFRSCSQWQSISFRVFKNLLKMLSPFLVDSHLYIGEVAGQLYHEENKQNDINTGTYPIFGLCRSTGCKVTSCQSWRFENNSASRPTSKHTSAARVQFPVDRIILQI